ncbi:MULTISPECIES: GNAT family N-acetyltransferase [unclassified Lysobacter]|uniref:GNAT family N-acetyltransferase n=1 Tax=unclassified Lysobacter TaxID=2635362 RepID=UPI000A43D856|nr:MULTISPECIES: GNAT family N-acetyltransferase [unclassified Lysobacter]
MSAAPQVRLLGRDEIAVLERVAADVFDQPIDPRWAGEFFADPRHHLAVALLDGEVVGMASALHYVHPDKPPTLWINEVGVTAALRRRGIARQLMAALLVHGRALGCSEAWVATEFDNTAARGLYAALGGQEAPMLAIALPLDGTD